MSEQKFNEDHLQVNQKIQVMVKEHERLIYEKMFVEKYVPLNKAKEFWLAGKSRKEIKSLMEQYLQDFSNAFHSTPSWVVFGSHVGYHVSKVEIENQNIKSFKIVMRMEWEKSQ